MCFSFKTSSAWCWSAVTDMSGVRMGPRASPSVVTRVSMARVWAQTRVTVSRALEELTARNVRILTTLILLFSRLNVFSFQFVTRVSGAQAVSGTARVRMAPRVTP